MASILDSLPGVPMPIPEISRQLREMWKGDEHSKSAAPSEFRASQLNLIIHFGWKTTPEEAQAIFTTAIEFTQRHPGRIILLAPSTEAVNVNTLDGKLFTQCYIGASHREMCCCEALLLEYASDEPRSLFNQVSVWLESDLPVYHWFHRIPVKAVKNKYLVFVKNAKRILYDSAIEEDDYTEIPTPDEWRIRDLADARMLPIKQSIGQVLSTYDPALILDGLQSVQVQTDAHNRANASQLKNWLQVCLKNTEGFSNLDPKPKVTICTLDAEDVAMRVNFLYQNDQQFRWSLCKSGVEAVSATNLGQRKGEHKANFRKPGADTVLAEAVFFGR